MEKVMLTEEKKKIFVNWLEELAITNRLYEMLKTNPLAECGMYAVCSTSEYVHLTKEAFDMAVSILKPEVTSRFYPTPFCSDLTTEERRFKFKNCEFLSIRGAE